MTLCAGACSSFNGSPGINRFSQPLVAEQGISVTVVRYGQKTANLQPSFTFNGSPQRDNFSEYYTWTSLTIDYLIQSS